MIGQIRGEVLSEEDGGALVIDVGGIGLAVLAPLGTRGKAKATKGDVTLFTHLVVRQDDLKLFGFATSEERQVFRLLIHVPNVGPKTALGILSALSVSGLEQLVQAGDVPRLTKVPGIGKKTAERLVLELKEKLLSDRRDSPATAAAGQKGRLIAALTHMGYRPQEAERAVKTLGQRVEDEPMTALLRESLKLLTP